MSVKRSRIVRSSSSGDTGVINQLSSPAADSPELRWHVRTALAFSGAPSLAPPPQASTDQRRPPPRTGILTLSSPAGEDWSQERIGNFLERCFYCKKRIRESDEVFMYGHLRAFCTTDCREKQVAMDKLREKRSAESKKVGGGQVAE
ncbi:FCS-Like Zinc finger 6 [Rhodamnia argentea]|uniref:FCS-Like Zinc finger 6 n=1 Tax=Rhodamnia argentea TaxID=178133 RepID=A0A8B8QFK8_9MYRT|nr:FCS-Like Zinc finger 6 [Rhodamnia argentea]